MKIVCVLPGSPPICFIKPDSTLCSKQNPFISPAVSDQIEAKVQLLVRITRIGKYINADFAYKYYQMFSFGLNFVATKLLSELKAKGLPWDTATAFDASMLLGDFISKDQILTYNSITCYKNQSNIFSTPLEGFESMIARSLAVASELCTFKIGDILSIELPHQPCIAVASNSNIQLKLDDLEIASIYIG